MTIPSLQRSLWWSALVIAIAFGFYKIEFRKVLVESHRAIVGDISAEVMGTGTLESHIKTTISTRIQERLADVLVDQGDNVKSGQLLARLDEAELRQQVAIAEAALAAARMTVERVRADEARAQAVLQLTRLEYKRISDLVATRVASQSDFDKAVESLRIAEADLERSQAAIEEAQSQTLTAEKTLRFREEQLAYTEIRSPYDGLIVHRDRDPGEVVVPGSSLLRLVDISEIWVSAWVDETAATRLAIGQPARVVFRSDSEREYPGVVARLGRETDRETREFLVDVKVNELPRNWTIGQRAEVYVETGSKSGVVIIPPAFVFRRDGKAGVYINDHGRARWRGITTGLQGRMRIEVMQGLSSGDEIVKPPEGSKQSIVDGQRIGAK